MKKESNNSKPHVVRLPGFLVENEIGLGDFIKKVTASVGINTCGGCDQRAAVLNKWVAFHNKNK